MKKYGYLLLMGLLLSSFDTIGHAGEKILVISDGKVSIQANAQKEIVKIRISEEASTYPNQAKEAFLSPGRIIPIKEEKQSIVVDLFHYKTDKIRTLGVKYDPKENLVFDVDEHERLGSKRSFLFFPIFWLLSLLLFFAGGKTMDRNSDLGNALAITAFVPALAAALAITLATTASVAIATVAIAAAAVATLATAVAVVDENRKVSNIFGALFYLLMLFSAVVVYWPLLA
jgi:hypothetical protein